MIQTRYSFNGKILVKGVLLPYKCEVIASSRKAVGSKVKDKFIEENGKYFLEVKKVKLNRKILTVIVKELKEKEKVLL